MFTTKGFHCAVRKQGNEINTSLASLGTGVLHGEEKGQNTVTPLSKGILHYIYQWSMLCEI